MAILSYNSSLRIQVRHTQHKIAAQNPLFSAANMPWITGVFWIHTNWRILSIKSFPLTVGVPAHSSSFCPLNCNVEESWVNISASKQFHRKTRAKTHGWTASGPPTQHRHRWYFKTLQQHFWMTIRGPNGLSGIQVECSFISVTWSILHWFFHDPFKAQLVQSQNGRLKPWLGCCWSNAKAWRIKSAQMCQRFAMQCLSRVVTDKAWLNLRATTSKIRLKYCMFIHMLHHIMCIWIMLHHTSTRISPSMPK